MPVLTRQVTVPAPVEAVSQLLTNAQRLPEYTQVSGAKEGPPGPVVAGARWKNRGATLKLPSWDSTTVQEVTNQRIAWHTRSMVLGFIPVGADWSYTLEKATGGTTITNTFERVTMFGLPVGALIKAPFLPMVYLARGSMMASEKRLKKTLGAT
ncbi:MAG: SRPBCC family protein [Chloroflexi bacterium]|nr:SRPBCC family protein [Chloroflexota bacterium]